MFKPIPHGPIPHWGWGGDGGVWGRGGVCEGQYDPPPCHYPMSELSENAQFNYNGLTSP